MPRGRLWAGGALIAVAALSALLVVVVAWERRESDRASSTVGTLPAGPRPGPQVPGASDGPTAPTTQPSPLVARGTFARRIVLFGDAVDARVDVVVDRGRFDPESVRVSAVFSPWEIVGSPERVRRDADGSLTHVRTIFVLRCLSSVCLFGGQAGQIEFEPARVAVGRAGGEVQRFRVNWPVLTVYSRYGSGSFQGRAGLATPWRADLVALPSATPRAAPGLVLALLVLGGALFAVAGGALLYRARPRRAPEPVPEPVAPPPLPRIPPLQQALALLEDAARVNGTEERRRSLELVAESLDEFGDDDLARAARILAWSEGAPAVEETASLATRVRATLAEELELAAADEGSNGRVV